MIVKLRTSRRLVFPALLNMHTYSSQLPTHTPLNSPIHSPHRVSLIECCDVVIVLGVAVVVVLLVVAVVGVVSMHNASPRRCNLMSACFTADTNSGKIPKNVMRQFLCRGASVIIITDTRYSANQRPVPASSD